MTKFNDGCPGQNGNLWKAATGRKGNTLDAIHHRDFGNWSTVVTSQTRPSDS